MKLIKQLSLMAGLLALFVQPSWGIALAGHVILTKGNVTAVAEDGNNRTLKRRSQIFNGDIIKTGPTGSIQIRFVDKALMTIKANSEMNIESYLLAQQDNSEQKEQVIMSLVKGGFRTITGTIGKGDKSAYKVNTPAASIGIRGTNYEVQQESDGSFVMGVYSGAIQVENEAGTINLGEGADFNFTRVKPKSSPKGLLAPPPALGENSATEQTEEESEDNTNNESDNGEDGDNNDAGTQEGELTKNKEDSQSLSGFANTVPDTDSNINNAIDSKLAGTIENTAQKVEEELINKGIIGTFDFKDPYRGIDTSNTNNPFDESIITDEQYALGESGRLGLIAVPVNFNFGPQGTPEIPLAEAMLLSSQATTDNGHSFASENGRFSLSYDVYNVTTKETDRYEFEFLVDFETTGDGDLLDTMNNSLTGSTYVKNNETISGTPPLHIFIDYTGEYKYEFTPISGDDDNFVLNMELSFDDDPSNAAATLALQQELGSSTEFDRDEWYSSSEIELIIANGSWDATGNKPIMLEIEMDEDGNRIAVIRKPNESNHVASSLLEYFDIDILGQTITATCGNGEASNPTPCDIQIDNAGGRSNISWGIWFTEPSEGILFDEIKENGTSESSTENEILAFWIAAERADINQLTGSASFSASNLDCTVASQCLGFADDGLVRNLSANFDVNFNSGAITNGNLNIQTATDLDSVATSTWDVNFSGSMMKDGVKQPEFSTESLSGTINEADANIIGNIGGIFVKPGDKFAGAYNLGTADGTNKHAAGVFTMDKQ
jgi:hypothetical protein